MTSNKWIQSGVLLLAMSMTLSGAAVMAQQSSAPATTQSQSAKPNLSAEQKQKLHELRASARDQAAIIRNDQTLTPAQRQQKLQELRASTREQMKSVLTPEQQQAFAARREARKEAFAAKLGLTTDQQSKMKELFQSTRQQRQAVLTNSGLSNDQKAAQLSQIRQNAKTQLASILSPDQLNQLEQMRGAHRFGKAGNM